MIILDTNVVSDAMKPRPSPTVAAWLGQQAAGSIFTTAITRAEILLGLHLLPAGKRRAELESAADAMFDSDFAGRVLPFDDHAAVHYARLVAARRKAGRPISEADAYIAAIAASHGARVATRNVSDFVDTVGVIDPWQS